MLDTKTKTVGERVAQVVADIARRNGVTKPIEANDGLVDKGMSSIAMVDLMLAIEVEFDMTIPQRDLTPETFKSIASIEKVMSALALKAA